MILTCVNLPNGLAFGLETHNETPSQPSFGYTISLIIIFVPVADGYLKLVAPFANVEAGMGEPGVGMAIGTFYIWKLVD